MYYIIELMTYKAKLSVVVPLTVVCLLVLNSSVTFGSSHDLLQTIKFDCNSDGQCVRNPNGPYTSAVCNNACQPPQDVEKSPANKSFSGAPPPRIPTEGLPDFGQLIAMIFTWSLNILGIVVFVMIFYSGFRWFTAAGNTAQVNEAREKITNAITGAIILVAAWVILYTINPDLVGSSLTFPAIEAPPTQQNPVGPIQQ